MARRVVPYAVRMSATTDSSGVRLVEVLACLSLATDLGLGQPTEHMLRATRIATRLGQRLGLGDHDRQCVYEVSLLTYVGCPVYGNEAAGLFGDDIDFRRGVSELDMAGTTAMAYMLRRAGAGSSPLHRASRAATLMATGAKGVVAQMADHCAAAGRLASNVGLSDQTRAGVEQTYARWDGKGVPAGLKGDELSLAARVAHVAEAAEVFHRSGGLDAAVELVAGRRGTHFDPAVVDAVTTGPAPLFAALDDDAVDAALDAEPSPRGELTEEELDTVLAAIGDFADLRCPWFAGHARGTATLAAAAASQLQLPVSTVTLVRRAGFVHDLGRMGVPANVWAKPGPLTDTEGERMRLHTYLVERMFNRPGPLRRVGTLAATHHERIDGTGYHRGLSGALIAAPGRVLAAADAYHAMSQQRPHRPAVAPDAAAAELRGQAAAGHLDHVAVDAVLVAAGQSSSGARSGGPAGLTAREAEVLGLLAQGHPTKQIARRLGIRPRTVGTHIEHLYTKLDVSSRAAATLYAMEYGLVQPGDIRDAAQPRDGRG